MRKSVVITIEIRERTSNHSGETPPGVSQSEFKRVYPRSTRTHAASMMVYRREVGLVKERMMMGVCNGGKTDESDNELVNVSGFQSLGDPNAPG